jgi:hypothetical protein
MFESLCIKPEVFLDWSNAHLDVFPCVQISPALRKKCTIGDVREHGVSKSNSNVYKCGWTRDSRYKCYFSSMNTPVPNLSAIVTVIWILYVEGIALRLNESDKSFVVPSVQTVWAQLVNLTQLVEENKTKQNAFHLMKSKICRLPLGRIAF